MVLSVQLVQLIIALAPYGAEIIVAIISGISLALTGGKSVPTVTQITKDIIDGINLDHPDWTSEQKNRYIADAIAQWHLDNKL